MNTIHRHFLQITSYMCIYTKVLKIWIEHVFSDKKKKSGLAWNVLERTIYNKED